MALTETDCKRAFGRAGLKKLSDGGGLQLWLMPSGSKYWRLAYRENGKQKILALGTYPDIGLEEARTARDEAKKAFAGGKDIQIGKLSACRARGVTQSFGAIANEYVAKLRAEERAEATIDKVEWLLGLCDRSLGPMPIQEIEVSQIFHILKEIESTGRHHSTHRLRSLIGAVFRYAVATGRATTDPTPTLRGALIRERPISRAAIVEPLQFGALLRAIDDFDGYPATAAALTLMALLFPRPGELRGAQWQEFDSQERAWVIPANRTKMRRIHRVPLSSQAIEILDKLYGVTGYGPLLFPSVRTAERPISENTLNAALRRLGYTKDEMTSHGFRASASTLLNESGKWHPDAIERQLAHIEQNEVRRAYTRGEHWAERVQMMQWWADHLDQLRTAQPMRQLSRWKGPFAKVETSS